MSRRAAILDCLICLDPFFLSESESFFLKASALDALSAHVFFNAALASIP